MQMRGRLILVLAVALFTGGLFLLSRNREPSYGGKSLTEWLQIYAEWNSATATSTQAVEAVRQIGTNALPLLLAWVREDRGVWKDKLDGIRTTLPPPIGKTRTVRRMTDKTQILHFALFQTAFRLMGESADPAIPELTRLMNHPNDSVSKKAMLALAHMGKDGRIALFQAVPDPTNRMAQSRTVAIAVALFASDAWPQGPTLTSMGEESARNYITNAVRKVSPESLTSAAFK